MKALLLLLLATFPLSARYLPPAAENLQVQRELLPLDVDRQRDLAKDLLLLASRTERLKGKPQSRATAQLVALASALDPSSSAPKELSERLKRQDELGIYSTTQGEHATQRIARLITFLNGTEGAPEGKRLATLLLDPIGTIDPHLPISATKDRDGEEQRWQNTVAPLALFTEPKPEPKLALTPSTPPKPTEPAPPQEEAEVKPRPTISPYDGSLYLPAFTTSSDRLGFAALRDDAKIEGRLSQLTFNATTYKGEKPEVNFLPRTLTKSLGTCLTTVNQTVRGEDKVALLESLKGTFRLQIEDYYSYENEQSFTLPMALLMEGCLSERQLWPRLTVFGEVKADGTVTSPAEPWKFLDVLLRSRTPETRRLIVPRDIYPYLEAFLTVQEEDFFFQYDVFCVDTLTEAFTLAFVGSQPPATEAAVAAFQEIRKVAEGKTTSVFIANPHVISRLEEVVRQEPRLISAPLLLTRGRGEQSAFHSTQVLSSRLSYALNPLEFIVRLSYSDLNSRRLERAEKECRKRLEPIERYITMDDRELHIQARRIADMTGSLARILNRAEKSGTNADRMRTVSASYSKLKVEHFKLAKQLALHNRTAPPKDR